MASTRRTPSRSGEDDDDAANDAWAVENKAPLLRFLQRCVSGAQPPAILGDASFVEVVSQLVVGAEARLPQTARD